MEIPALSLSIHPAFICSIPGSLGKAITKHCDFGTAQLFGVSDWVAKRFKQCLILLACLIIWSQIEVDDSSMMSFVSLKTLLNENMKLSIVHDYLSRACHGANVVQNMIIMMILL